MEKYQLNYREENGYLYPCLALPEQTHYEIGKYGRLHLKFIKEHRRGTYATLLTEFWLNEYLHKIDVNARETVSRITTELAQKRGITEEMKASDPLRWIREMNNCRACAEETVMREVVYV